MKAATTIQAEKIARAGWLKMTAEKYTVKACTIKSLIGKQFTIINHENGKRYTTSIDPKKTFCSCPFFQENKEFGVCKHIYRAQEEAADLARWQEEEEARAEYAGYGRWL